jgi:hypothetical protein
MSGQRDIVVEAQRLRDYLLHKGGVDQSDLINALHPFEGSSQAAPDDYMPLQVAFQATKERCSEIVDDLTLSEVLKGRSPYQEPGHVIASAGVTLIGVLLVVLAVYFANWSQRATHLLAEADNFANFDHFGRMTRLIELAGMLENDTPTGSETVLSIENFGNLTPEDVVILESVYELRRHYARENRLFADMSIHISRINPVVETRANLQRRFCPPAAVPAGEPPALSRWEKLLGCIQPRRAVQPAPPAEGSIAAEPPFMSQAPHAFQAIAWFQGQQLTAMEIAERQQPTEYTTAVQQVRDWADKLSRSLTMVSRIFLPIIYGALGSIVYCMWRLLNPATSPLGFWYTLLRTSFAGLAALTLSALIVPSNTLAMGTEVTRPFVYMLSFIFGYSIEAFVNTLNSLNRVLVTSIGPREKK